SSTAPPSHTPPRRCLRGFSAHAKLAHGRISMPVCAAVGGPVSAASLKRTLHGWTAPALRWAARRRSGPRRLGNALEQLLRLTSPRCPLRAQEERHQRRCALPVPLVFLTPKPPCHGASHIAYRSCQFLGQRSALPWESSQHGHRHATVR